MYLCGVCYNLPSKKEITSHGMPDNLGSSRIFELCYCMQLKIV